MKIPEKAKTDLKHDVLGCARAKLEAILDDAQRRLEGAMNDSAEAEVIIRAEISAIQKCLAALCLQHYT